MGANSQTASRHVRAARLLRGLVGSCSGLALAGVVLGPAWAQTGSATDPSPTGSLSASVDEVVVTARQRAETLKDVPAAISVLSGATLQAAGVRRVENIVALTPGVSIVNGAAEQGDTQVNIRGVNGARDAEPSFAYVVDGVQIANPSAFNREFIDLSQIEIVKGPQGAVYGRDATAGAIIVTTHAPGDALTGSMLASAGNYGSYAVQARIAGPVMEHLAGSVSVDYRRTDGQYRNSLFTGQNALDFYQGGNIDGRLVYTPDSVTSLDLKLHYGRVDAGAIDYNAVFALPAFASVTQTAAFDEDVNAHRFTFQNNVASDNQQTSRDVSLKFERDLGWAHLTAWGLYSDIDNDLIADGTSASFGFFNAEPHCAASTAALSAAGVTLPAPQGLGPTPATSFFGPYTPTTCDGYQYQRRDQTDGSLEIRLTSPAHQRLRWLGGVYYLHVDRSVGVATGIDSGGAPPRSLFVAAGEPYSTEQLLDDRFKGDVGAVFGQAQYDIVSNLEGSFALRYDSENRSVHNLVPASARTLYIDYDGPPYTGGAPLNPALDAALNPAGVTDKSKAYSEFQPKVGLRWTASRQWTVYGDWGIGFKSGGFNNEGSQATVDTFINPIRISDGFAPVSISDQYKKEVSSEFELGAKGRLFDGRVTVDASIYDTSVDNMQFFEFFVGPFGLLRVVSNIDRVKLDGAELGLAWKAAPGLTFDGSAAYTYSRIEKNAVRPDTVGNKSPYTPDYTWNLGAQYDRPLANDFTLQSRLDVRGTGPTWFSDVQDQSNPTVFEAAFGPLGRANYSKSERAAFTTVDLRIGVERRGLTLTAYGRNILDQRYLNEVIPAAEFGGSFISPAPTARYGVELGYRF